MQNPQRFERSEPDPPSAEEVAALLNEAWRDPAWGMFLWLTTVSGCRRGEMCALRWTDLDLTRGIMTVERSYSRTVKRSHEKSTKDRQKRCVAMDAYTVELLAAYRAQCESERAALHIELAPGLPLPTCAELAAKHGVSAGTVNRAIAVLKKAGLVSGQRGKRIAVIGRAVHTGGRDKRARLEVDQETMPTPWPGP